MEISPTDLEDRDAVAAVLAGDTDRFAHIVRRYRGPLLNMANNRLGGNLDLAEDVIQETLVAAFRSLHTYQSAYSFRTWLWTILLNQCRRHGAKFSKLPSQSNDAVDGECHIAGVTPTETPECYAMVAERNQLLRELLDRLPENRADALRLRFFGQLKYREIADALGCSLSASKKWVREGLELMSDMLREREPLESVWGENS